ncbi:MAG: long-chain fatty acid--CoA ligase [Desulfobacteraceae bacterium]|nr:long-chain fatty acid--CoA ligase [Desulfobacteraceae bacterium]
MDTNTIYTSKPWLKFYPPDVPATVDVPLISVPEMLDQTAAKFKNNTALIFYGKKITYGELLTLINRCATGLAAMGVKKGDTVALYLLNSPQFIISYFGALKAGAKVTPVSPVYTSQEVRHQLQDSEAKTIICENMLFTNVERTGAKLDNIILSDLGDFLPWLKRAFAKKMISKAYQGLKPPTAQEIKSMGLHVFKEFIQAHPPNPPAITFDPKNDIAALPYTGGTTGLPKAAMLTHYNMSAICAQARAWWPFVQDGKETIIAFLPLFHIYGQAVLMLAGLTRGQRLVLFTTPDLEEIINAVERYEASAFFGVPTLYEFLKEYDKTDRVNWKRLQLIVCGADTLHDTTCEGWQRRTGTQIVEGFGMTECTAVSHGNPIERPKKGSFGIPLPNIDAAVADMDTLTFKPIGEEGELLLSGPNVMQGYWKRPDANQETFVEIAGKRWMRTGDLVRMDEEGYFYFFDRKRDLIKHKGYSVFARHVEEVLYLHPQVKAAGVVGVPDPKVGQIIKAYVVLQSEARGKVSEEEIIEFCRQNLAHYKVPGIIEFRGELPKTDVGKVSRRELRDEAEEI